MPGEPQFHGLVLLGLLYPVAEGHIRHTSSHTRQRPEGLHGVSGACGSLFWFRFHSSAIQIQLEVDPEGTTLHSMPRLRKVGPGVGTGPWVVPFKIHEPRDVCLSRDRRYTAFLLPNGLWTQAREFWLLSRVPDDQRGMLQDAWSWIQA